MRFSTLRLAPVLSLACVAPFAATTPTPRSTEARDAATVVRALRATNAFPALDHATASNAIAKLGGSAMRVATTDTSTFVDVTPADDAHVAREVIDGASVFRDVADDTDAVEVATAEGLEEIRLLRSPRAQSSTRYRIHLGGDARDLKIDGDHVVVTNADGVTEIATTSLFAVDARGERRTLRLEASGEGADRTLIASLDTIGLAYPIAVDPFWTSGPTLPSTPLAPSVTTLTNGNIFIFGGHFSTSSPSATDAWVLYNPTTNAVTSGTGAGNSRMFHAAVQLPGGKVLIAGGTPQGVVGPLSGAFVIDPATKTTTTVDSMTYARIYPSGIWVPSIKRAVIFGGETANGGGIAYLHEAFDPTAATGKQWTEIAGCNGNEYDLATALLPSGKVLLTGGYHQKVAIEATGPTTATQIFDPAKLSCTAGPPMHFARQHHTAITMSDGRVMVAGGTWTGIAPNALTATVSTEIYDPTANTWSDGPDLPAARIGEALSPLPNGRVLVVGGNDSAGNAIKAAFRLEPSSKSWLPVGSITSAFSVAYAEPTTAGAFVLGDGLTTTELFADEGSLGTACTVGTTCDSGFCSDGVCCDSACTGTCAACDATGKCGAVTGAPTGATRAATCTGAGSGTPCGPTCDGTDMTACHPANKSAPCGSNTCASNIETHTAFCDGAGACADVPKNCGAYVCASDACKTSCTTAADCATGFECQGGICNNNNTCSADGLSVVDTSGATTSCDPYRCQGGACLKSCATTDDCVSGATCDPTTKACTVSAGAGGGTGSSGGCAIDDRSSGGLGAAFFGALVAAFGVATRRRRR